jgi:hypothetical protein
MSIPILFVGVFVLLPFAQWVSLVVRTKQKLRKVR